MSWAPPVPVAPHLGQEQEVAARRQVELDQASRSRSALHVLGPLAEEANPPIQAADPVHTAVDSEQGCCHVGAGELAPASESAGASSLHRRAAG